MISMERARWTSPAVVLRAGGSRTPHNARLEVKCPGPYSFVPHPAPDSLVFEQGIP
jgi:hypothetical protein